MWLVLIWLCTGSIIDGHGAYAWWRMLLQHPDALSIARSA